MHLPFGIAPPPNQGLLTCSDPRFSGQRLIVTAIGRWHYVLEPDGSTQRGRYQSRLDRPKLA